MNHVVDYHHHVTPPEYVAAMSALGVKGNTGVKFKKFDPEKNVKIMDRVGIDKAMLSISTPGVYVKDDTTSARIARIVNEYIRSAIDLFPERYGGFAALPYPAEEESLRELEYALDVLKLDGVVLLTNVKDRYVGEPGYDELFCELNKRHALVFFHPEDFQMHGDAYLPITLTFERVLSTVRAGYNLLLNGYLDRFPDIRFIFAHGGGGLPVMARRVVDEYIKRHDLPADQKIIDEKLSLFRKCFYDTAQRGASILHSLAVFCGTDHVVFGSDLPYQAPMETKMIRKAIDDYEGLSSEERQAIYAGSAVTGLVSPS